MQGIGREKLVDVIPDLDCEAVAHFDDVGVSHVFVRTGTEEGHLGVHEGEVVLDELHVQRVALEAVHQHRQMQRYLKCTLGLALRGLLWLGVGVFDQEAEVLSFVEEVLAHCVWLKLQFASLEQQLLLVLLVDAVDVFGGNAVICNGNLMSPPESLPHLLLRLHV